MYYILKKKKKPRPQHPCHSGGDHPFSGLLTELKIQEAPQVNKDSLLISFSFTSSRQDPTVGGRHQ
jgi:hypothetical protein